MRNRRLTLVACAAGVAVAIGGCGEVSNTIHPHPGTASTVKLLLAGPPNALYAGIYNAMALGYFKRSDMNVMISTPSMGQNPLIRLHHYQTQIAVSNQPNVLLTREQNIPVVSVGAIIQQPLSSVHVKLPPLGKVCQTEKCKQQLLQKLEKQSKKVEKQVKKDGGKVTITQADLKAAINAEKQKASTLGGAKPTTVGQGSSNPTDEIKPPANATAALTRASTPAYQGLVFVVRKATIVNGSPVIRRFLQTAARGYEAARRDPGQAVNNMIKEVPALIGQKTKLLASLKAFLPDMFPATPTEKGPQQGKPQPWGFQDTTQWNQFGNWLHLQHLIEDPQAVTEASTNDLLAGKGI